MKKIYLFLFILPCLVSCEDPVDPAVEAQQARQAAFAVFAPQFPAMEMDTIPTFSCESASYGPHLSEPASDVLLSDSLMLATFPKDLLGEAGFLRADESGNLSFASDNEYYALGSFPFAEGLEAYLIGAFENESMYSTHLFIFDKNAGDFAYTQSLNFLMDGGAFRSSRKAWLYDYDGDAIRDVIYLLNMSAENDLGEKESMISDSLRAEVWIGNGFEVKSIDDTYYLRSVLNGEDTGGDFGVDDVSDFF
jgi:hypothetical protein